MICSIKNKDDLKDSEDLVELKSKVQQVRLEEKLDNQGFHYNTKELFEKITEGVTDISEKLL